MVFSFTLIPFSTSYYQPPSCISSSCAGSPQLEGAEESGVCPPPGEPHLHHTAVVEHRQQHPHHQGPAHAHLLVQQHQHLQHLEHLQQQLQHQEHLQQNQSIYCFIRPSHDD